MYFLIVGILILIIVVYVENNTKKIINNDRELLIYLILKAYKGFFESEKFYVWNLELNDLKTKQKYKHQDFYEFINSLSLNEIKDLFNNYDEIFYLDKKRRKEIEDQYEDLLPDVFYRENERINSAISYLIISKFKDNSLINIKIENYLFNKFLYNST